MTQEGGAVLTIVRSQESGDLETGEENLNKKTKHHRRLKSNGGGHSRENISIVSLLRHRAWHALYQDELPEVIDRMFRQDYEVFGTDFVKSDLMKKLHEGWANNSKEKIKRREAWYTLFADKTLQEIVDEVNRTWIDPAYELRVETMRVLTTRVVTRVAPVVRAARKITRPTHF